MRAHIELRGVAKLLKDSERFRRFFPRSVVRGARRGLSKTATKVRREVRATSLGRRITLSPWGKQGRNRLTSRVKVFRPRIGSENRIELVIGLFGFPAVLEGGGRIVRHTVCAQGRTFTHPGQDVAAHNFGAPALRSDQGQIAQAVDGEIGRLIGETFGV